MKKNMRTDDLIELSPLFEPAQVIPAEPIDEALTAFSELADVTQASLSPAKKAKEALQKQPPNPPAPKVSIRGISDPRLVDALVRFHKERQRPSRR